MRVHDIDDRRRAGQGAGAGLALNPNLGAGGDCLPPLPQVPVLKLMYDAGTHAYVFSANTSHPPAPNVASNRLFCSAVFGKFAHNSSGGGSP